jgi:acetolactate decarboxylase
MSLISTMAAGTIRTDQSFEHHACFLVYAEVPQWRWIAQSRPLPAWPTLESLLRRVAADAGINPDGPFPFRLVGSAESGIFHVLDKRDEQRHSPERHEQVKVRFALADEEVDMIGFYSTQHQGIFVPRDSPIHAHLAARGRTIAGHVDALRLGLRWQLGLPSSEPEETRT